MLILYFFIDEFFLYYVWLKVKYIDIYYFCLKQKINVYFILFFCKFLMCVLSICFLLNFCYCDEKQYFFYYIIFKLEIIILMIVYFLKWFFENDI